MHTWRAELSDWTDLNVFEVFISSSASYQCLFVGKQSNKTQQTLWSIIWVFTMVKLLSFSVFCPHYLIYYCLSNGAPLGPLKAWNLFIFVNYISDFRIPFWLFVFSSSFIKIKKVYEFQTWTIHPKNKDVSCTFTIINIISAHANMYNTINRHFSDSLFGL